MKRFVAAMVLSLALPQATAAALYVCNTTHAYDNEAGALRPEKTGIRPWETVIFDSDTGAFRYGNDRTGFTESQMTLTARGSQGMPASGYRLHNGTLLEAIVVAGYASPPTFTWLGGGLSEVLTGTCRVVGE